ncbi:MAG: DUF2853 family protein [Hyphomicrobiaceae bacterium]|nr:DUF2853 family protein [Hyphomicrobiaceae bacterium]MCC0010487.1 DUF2853 family protein [Hyphomicrobiaceae bacterium]
MSTDHIDDVKRYASGANEKAVAGIVKHLGIALKSKDASLVSCSSKEELARVHESWCKKKLGQADDAAIDAAIKEVCEKMKADKQKKRVTFYYLLAEKFGKVDALA